MPFIQLQFRRGNASQWTSANPILADGELAIETDTSRFKIGNGIGSWTLLPYGGLVGPTGSVGNVVSIDISFNGNIFVGKDVSFGGKFTVRNDVSFNTELRVGGNVNIRSNAIASSSLTGALIVAGGVGVSGNVWTGGNLIVGLGDASFNNRLNVGGDVNFNGGNLNISKTTASTSTATGALIVGGGVGVGGSAWIANNLNVALDASFNSRLFVDKDVSFGAKLFVESDASFNGNTSFAFLPVYNGSATPATNQLVTKSYVDTNGGAILLSANNTWTANNTFNGSRFYVNADASFQNKLTVGDDVSLNARLLVGGNVVVGRNLVLVGDASFNDNMSVQSDSSFNNRLYVGRQIGVGVAANAAYALDVFGNINLSGSLFLNNKLFSITSADISLNANLSVGADSSFNGNVFIAKTLNLKKTVVTGAAVGSPTSIVAATPIVEITGTGAPTAYFNLENGLYAGQTLTINSATNGGGGGLYVNATSSNIIFNGSNCSQMRFSNAFQTVNLLWSSDVSDWIVASWQGVNFGGVSMNFGTYTSGDITLGAAGRVNINPSVGGMVVGADSSFNGNLSVGGTDSSFNANLYVGVGKRVGIGRSAGATYALDVGGNINLTGNLFTNGVLFSAFDNSKDISLNANLSVASDSSFNANLFIGRRLTVGSGDVSLNQRLTVGGADSSFNGNLYVGGSINSDAYIERFVNIGSSSGSYVADFNNGLIIYINAFSGSSTPTLSIANLPTLLNQNYVFTVVYSGAATSTYFSALNINGVSVPINGSVSLSAAASYYVHQFAIFFTDATTISNNLVVQSFNSSAPLSLVSPLISGNLAVSGNINLTGGSIYQNGVLFSGGGGGSVGTSGNSLSLSGNLYVGGDISFGGKLFGNGDVSLNGNLNMFGHMRANTITCYSSIISTAGNMDAFNITSNNRLSVVSTTESSNKNTGALIVGGGAGVNGNVSVGGNINFAGSLYQNGVLFTGGGGTSGTSLSLSSGTASTTPTTGALTVVGGVGIGGALYVGGSIVSPSLTGTPLAPTATGGGAGSTQIATTAYVRGEINTLLGGAGAAFDTLNELAAALGNDGAFSTTVTNSIATKAPLANPTFTGTVNAPALSVTDSTASASSITGALRVTGGAGITGNVYTGGIVNVGGAVASTNTTSGALIVGGTSGVGVGGNIFVGGSINATSTRASTNNTTGSLIVSGGAGITGNVYAGGIINTTLSTESTDKTTGALIVSGGAGIGGNVKVGGNIDFAGNIYKNGVLFTGGSTTGTSLTLSGVLTVNDTTESTSKTTGALRVAGGVGVVGNVKVGGNVDISSSIISTSTTTGALRVAGGVGVVGNLFVGGNANISRMTIGNGGQSESTALGTNAFLTGVVGANNTAIGYDTLKSQPNQNNTAVGAYSLSAHTGQNATAVGAGSLQRNTTGNDNIGVGMVVLQNNTTGSENTAVGAYALFNQVDKIKNTAIGHSAGRGTQASYNGSYNTFIGSNTYQEGTGDFNTYIGYRAYSNGTYGNSTAIGVGSLITANNQIVLGTNTEFVSIPGSAASTSTITGALRVAGGVGVGGNLYVGGKNSLSGYNYIFEFENNLLNTGTSGATFNGTGYGTPTYSTINSAVGTQSLSLNGTSQYVTIPNFQFSTSGFSIAFWAKINAPSTSPTVIKFNNNINSNHTNLYVFNGGNFCFDIIAGGNTSQVINGGQLFGNNQWYYFTYTASYTTGTTGTMKSYVNGVLNSTSTSTRYPVTSEVHTVYIGRDGTSGPFATMLIDNFIINNGVWTDANVTAIYNNEVLGNATESSNKNTGALIVGGGAGVNGNVSVGGNINFAGSLYQNGVLFTGGGGTSGTSLSLSSGTASTSSLTGALTVVGGVGIGGNINVGNNLTVRYPSASLQIAATHETQEAALFLATPNTGNFGRKTAIIAKGMTSFSRADLMFCLNQDTTSNETNVTSADARMTIKHDTGFVGIGTTTPATMLQVNGVVTATSFNATSDYRIKQNVHLLDASFNVDGLRPVSFTNTNLGKQDIGFIAHEVGEHYPFLVNGEKDGEDMQSLNYTGIIGILVKEIQELKKQVAELIKGTK